MRSAVMPPSLSAHWHPGLMSIGMPCPESQPAHRTPMAPQTLYPIAVRSPVVANRWLMLKHHLLDLYAPLSKGYIQCCYIKHFVLRILRACGTIYDNMSTVKNRTIPSTLQSRILHSKIFFG